MLLIRSRFRPVCKAISSLILVLIVLSYTAAGVVKDGVVDPGFDVNVIDITAGQARIDCIVPLSDGRIVVCGAASFFSGMRSGGIAILNPDGTFDPSFRGRSDYAISDVFPLPDGKFLITGNFPIYDGIARNAVARIHADGSLDTSFAPNLGTAYVRIAAVQPDGKIIVVGEFLTLGGVPRNRLARLHPDGALDLSFEVGGGLNNAGVNKGIVQPDGKIILVGFFDSYDGVERDGVLRLNSDGSLDTGYDPTITAGFSEFFDASLGPDGKLCLVGDSFGSRPYRLLPDGSTDFWFNTLPLTASGGRAYSVLSQPDGKVLVGGDFDSFFINGNQNIHHQTGLIRFNADASVDTTFTTETDSGFGRVLAFSMDGAGKILVGGSFYSLNKRARGGIARMDLDGTIDGSFVGFLGIPAFVDNFLSFPDGKLLVGGTFHVMNTSFSQYAAKLNADGSPDTSFNIDPGVDRRVTANAIQPDGKIVLSVGSSVLRINPEGNIDSAFTRVETDTGAETIAIQDDGKILIAGAFTTVNGTLQRRLARLDGNGTLDPTFVPNVGGLRVNAVVVQPDGKILVGGSFSTFNGAPVSNVVRLNSDGSTDTSFDVGVGANNQVYSLHLLPDGRVYVGGNFNLFNGVARRSIVRLLPNASVDTTFKQPKIDGNVYSIESDKDGKVLIAGTCDSFSDAAIRQRLLRLLEDGPVDFSFDVSRVMRGTSSGEVFQVGVLANNSIFATGQFESVNGVQRTGMARFLTFANPTRPSFDYDGDGITDISVFRSANGIWYRRRSSVNASRATPFGQNGDRIVPADYDGDFRTDIAVFRPASGYWYVLNSSDDTVTYEQFGVSEDVPAPGDYDGDGKADLTVFRPSQGTWYRQNSSNGSFFGMQFGATGDVPTVGDFDGDGKNDLGIFRPSIGDWYNLRSSDGSVFGERFGQTGDRIAPADYDGDGKTDIAIFRPSTGQWVVRNSATATYSFSVFGAVNDVPVAGDYDGDGRADIGVWRPENGTWYVQRSSDSQFIVFPWGQNGDVPTPAAFGN